MGKGHKGKPSDVWALGVTLYYMAFNKYPFTANANEYEKLYSIIINNKPKFPEDYEDKTLIELIKMMLVKNPAKRITLDEIRRHNYIT